MFRRCSLRKIVAIVLLVELCRRIPVSNESEIKEGVRMKRARAMAKNRKTNEEDTRKHSYANYIHRIKVKSKENGGK